MIGEVDANDESINIDLAAVCNIIHKIVVNERSDEEVVRYDLSENYSIEAALIFE
ncbi:TerD family protein [Colwellia sp. C1TZA3]|uniref:TerD family protein n=1 Tax=Colwellia sp. C1TZA3 TaxID=2508879 RepID=UPI001CB90878